MTTAAPTKPLTVELPYCPRCGRIGKLPLAAFRGKQLCTGPEGSIHPRTKMVPKRFVEAAA